MDHPPSSMTQHDEDVEEGEVRRDDGEEVNGPGQVEMVPEEGQPSRRSAPWVSRPHHVLADRVLARRIVTEQPKRVPDPSCAPKGILSAQLPDQILHLLGYRRPAGIAP